MAKQKGHRANKPNDSFGTVNDGGLYRGNYRDEVYVEEDDETTVEAKDPSNEATPEQENDPDVYAIVETISTLRADDKLQEMKSEIQHLKGREKELEVKSAYKELLSTHPDFPALKKDGKFLEWLDKQPTSISDGIYKNNQDARWASRVLDLYKADMGIPKQRKKSRDSDPALGITKASAKNVVSEVSGNKKVWKASEIGRMKAWEFEKLETELDAARSEGRINFNA